jgi:tetratricopeptide (TPR) repeat protein
MVVTALGHGCRQEDPADLWFRAQVDYAAGRLAAADADFVQLARIRRLGVTEGLLRSEVLRDRGLIAEALAALDELRVPFRGPEAASIASRRGELEFQRYRFRAAEAELKRALDLDPERLDVRRRLVMLYAQQGRSAQVASWAPKLAITDRPEFLDLVIWTLARREPLDRAERAETLRKAVQADPDDRTSRIALAECLRRLGHLDEAVVTLSALSSAEPEVRCARARIALDQGDDGRAEILLGTTSDSSEAPSVSRLHGRLALGRGDAKSAAHHFRAALVADHDDRDSHFGLAQALSLAGQPEAARAHADIARAIDRLDWLVQRARPRNRRNDPGTLQAIAEACLAIGHRDQARAWYRLALSYDPQNPDLKFAVSGLEPIHPPGS